MARRTYIALALAGLALLLALGVGGYLTLWGLPEALSPAVLHWNTARFEREVLEQYIRTAALRLRVDPGAGQIEGTAVLQVEHRAPEGQSIHFLLNPGLAIRAARCNGGVARIKRSGVFVTLRSPRLAPANSIELTYQGSVTTTPMQPVWPSESEMLLPMLSFWCPVDLHSFTTFACTVQAPPGFEVIGGERHRIDTLQGGGRTYTWAESRPVMGLALAVGRYEVQTRWSGGCTYRLYRARGGQSDADELLDMLERVHGYFQSRFGPDGFPAVNLVLSEDVEQSVHGGNTTVALPVKAVADPDRAVLEMARQLAHNWWGGTVSGDWFTARPEAGQWLVDSLAEYSAWRALEEVRGKGALWRHREMLRCPGTISFSMNTLNLANRFQPDPASAPFALVRGPYAASLLAEYVGEKAFFRGCRQFFERYRHSTASYMALIRQLELASEQPLGELCRLWFDRGGTFDYAITSVSEEAGEARIAIENAGDLPAPVPLTLAISTGRSTRLYPLRAEAGTAELRAALDAPLKRVVLDPHYATPDMKRENNLWPYMTGSQ